MKKLLFGIAFVLALAITPKAHAYDPVCYSNITYDTTVQSGRTVYWENCWGENGSYESWSVSYVVWRSDRYEDLGY